VGQSETTLKEPDEELPAPPGERDWPQHWQGPFLSALSLLPDISSACRASRIGRATAYRYRDSDQAFRDAWDEALELARDSMQRIARQWATVGVPVRTRRTKRKVKNGVVIEEETIETEAAERSATMMIFWLKAWYPDRYRWSERVETTGAEGGPIRIESLDSIDRQIEKLSEELALSADRTPEDEPE
jgi:hypothetical protein